MRLNNIPVCCSVYIGNIVVFIGVKAGLRERKMRVC